MPQEITKPRSRIFYGYWILLVGFLCEVITHGCIAYGFSLYVIPLTNEFGWSRAAIMAGNLVSSLTLGLTSPLIGRAVYKWGSRWVITWGALVMGIGFALLSTIHTPWQFYASYLIVGIGGTATGVIPTSMVIVNWFKKRRGLAIGILGTGIGVGGFIMPIILGRNVIPNLGWRAGYLVSGIISIAILIPLVLWIIKMKPEDMGLLPDNDTVAENKERVIKEAKEYGLNLAQARKTFAFWIIGLGFFVFGIANGNIFQNHVPHLRDIGFQATATASVLSLVGIGSAIGKFSFGWLCDYIRPKYILIIGSALQAASTLILMNVTLGSSQVSLWLYAFLLGLGIGSWLPALSLTTSNTFGLVSYGVIFGVYNLLFQVAGSLGPWIGGRIFDTTGSYDIAFKLGLILFAIVVPCMLLVRRPRNPASPVE